RALLPAPANQRIANAGLGILHLHGAVLARDVHHQLAVASVRTPALSHRRYQPQQLVPRDPHARRGLAQQSSLLSEFGAPGFLLVGVRSDVLPAEAHVLVGSDLGPQTRADRSARQSAAQGPLSCPSRVAPLPPRHSPAPLRAP